MTESITCPRCGLTSYHPEDVREGYCGNCHQWTSDPREMHLVDVEVDEWTSIPPRLRPIERPRP